MTRKALPDLAQLQRFLRCDFEAGRLYWLPREPSDFQDRGLGHSAEWSCRTWNKRYAGTEAFTATNNSGYRFGCFCGVTYLKHRVIWKMAYGADPVLDLDHENRDRTDNRLSNLRAATPLQNSANMTKTRGASQYRGVSPHGRRWRAAIQAGGSLKHLGVFDDEADAARSYDAAAAARFGEFANLNFGG